MTASEDMHLCIDRIIPNQYQPARAEAHRVLQEFAERLPDGEIDASQVIPPSRMAIVTLKKWQTGKNLRCCFLDGNAFQQRKVTEKAQLWEEYANIHLDFGDDPDAEIRVSFRADPGSWSAVGTDALIEAYFPKFQPTMNFGWLRDDTDDSEYERVVVHEFGHALGCIHEHQSPGATLQWNEPEVYRVFSGPPNYWSAGAIKHNIIDRYGHTQTQFTTFDPNSIMLYAFPGSLFKDGKGTTSNTHLSETDKEFIAKLYSKS